MHLELVEGDGVTHLETGVVPGPGSSVAAVQETVTEQSKVSTGDTLPADLLQLPLLHQLPPWSDELPVSHPRLEPQHGLELVLQKQDVNILL